MSGNSFSARRAAARVALALGATGSLVLMWLSGRRPPAMLMLIFVFWVLAPFGALVAARRAARRWPALTLSDAALDLLAASLSAGSLLVYGAVVLGPWRAHVVRAFVLVPPLSTLLVAVSVAALATRR